MAACSQSCARDTVTNQKTSPFTVHLFAAKKSWYMNSTTTALTSLFNRIPRRHSLENVKDINGMVTEYENILITIEAENSFYEKNISGFFDDLENIRAAIKKSTDNKASKKNKDSYFDEASGLLKDSIQATMNMYEDGNRTT